MFLYHYYDAKIGPFKNISDLSVDDAKQLLDEIKKERPDCQCAKRQESYVEPYSVKLTIVLHPVFSAIIPAGN